MVCLDCYLKITEFSVQGGAIGGIEAKMGGVKRKFRVREAQKQYQFPLWKKELYFTQRNDGNRDRSVPISLKKYYSSLSRTSSVSQETSEAGEQ